MRDPEVAISTVVELIAKAKGDAEALALTIRTAQKAAGHALDTRADYAEGSAAAYSYALSIIAGAYGVANVDELTYAPMTFDDEGTLQEPLTLIAKAGRTRRVGESGFVETNGHFPVDHEYSDG